MIDQSEFEYWKSLDVTKKFVELLEQKEEAMKAIFARGGYTRATLDQTAIAYASTQGALANLAEIREEVELGINIVESK